MLQFSWSALCWAVVALATMVAPVVAKDETEWYDDGVGAVGAGDFKAAVADFKAAVSVDPRYKQGWEALAEALTKLGRLRQAARVRAVAEKAPDARAGDPPPLNDEQKRALADDEDQAPPGTPIPPQKVDPKVPPLVVPEPAGKPQPLAKLNKFDKGQYCDLVVEPSDKAHPNGTVHVIYSDQPSHMTPSFLYYRASDDMGKTWSEQKNLSDDESGHAVGYCRLLRDARGRLYAIWKYTAKDALIDGPGGNQAGILAYRCLDGGAWSRITRLTDEKVPAFSFFAANAPDGTANVIWSQMTPEGQRVLGWSASGYCNLVQRVPLDGATPGQVTVVTAPPPLPTEAEVEAARRAGHPIPYQQLRPSKDGLINLRGYIAADNSVRFVGEEPGNPDGPNGTGQLVDLWDGAQRIVLYRYEKFKMFNNFNNPGVLWLDSKGKEHLIRSPERAETPCVRDYPIEGGQLGDATNIISGPEGRGVITCWQATPLPGGRLAVTCGLSVKGGANPEDAEMYVSFSAGDGVWTKPTMVTNNAARASMSGKNTELKGTIALGKRYLPKMASVALDETGHPCLLMVDNEINGIIAQSPEMPTSEKGQLPGFNLTVDAPMVFFVRL
ncbi:MAG: hypothetical protein HZB16_07225 [Armatimonadetes bacterium]|nr:hypothetical protein [Armatimonadota bacterium]